MTAWREAAVARAATEQDLELREEIQAEDKPEAPEPPARTRDGQAPMATEDGMGDQANTGAEEDMYDQEPTVAEEDTDDHENMDRDVMFKLFHITWSWC